MRLTADEARAIPKVLLHDHLDGGLRPQTIIELAERIGYRDLPARGPEELAAWFRRGAETRDILQYLATFTHTLAVLQTAEALERVAAEAAADLSADGVIYAEVRFAPELHGEAGLAPDAVMEAVQSGFRRGEAEARAEGRPIEIGTIVCAMRTSPPATSLAVARLAVDWHRRDGRVVGFDLAGAETGFPPSDHLEAVQLARRELLPVTIHASEPPGLELIADALWCGAARIGHGVRLIEDVTIAPDGEAVLGPLAAYVRDRQVPLELAPTCNVQIGAVATLADHPLGRFHRMGFQVTVNTDNRLMSGVSSSSEVAAVAAAFDLSWADLEAIAVNSMRAAFCDLDLRTRLVEEVIRPAYAARPR